MPTDLNKIGELAVNAHDSEFWALRGRAIQTYASLEQSLCLVMAQAGQIPQPAANIIFHRLTASRDRNQAIEKLVKSRLGSEYSHFANSAKSELDKIAQDRNHIVHWNTVVFIKDNTVCLKLAPSGATGPKPTTKLLGIAEIEDFMGKCTFFTKLFWMFSQFLKEGGNITWERAQPPTWREIFQSPLEYPPPCNHPLYRTPEAPGIQHRPYPGARYPVEVATPVWVE